MWIPGLILISLLFAFLATVYFSAPVLTSDQRRFVLLVYALLAGFASLFLGGAAFVEAAGSVLQGFKFGFAAALAVVVFGACYLYPPPFLYGKKDAADRDR